MKNKGYTIIEIIISLSLIILIGTISIISFNKNKKEEENKKFIEAISLSSSAYIEVDKYDRTKLDILGDAAYIRLGKLIDNGYLKEEYVNPNTGSAIKDERNTCIKLTKNNDGIIDVEFGVAEDECNESNRKPLILLDLDSFGLNGSDSVSLADTNTMFDNYYEEGLSNEDYQKKVMSAIKDNVPTVFKDGKTWSDPGIIVIYSDSTEKVFKASNGDYSLEKIGDFEETNEETENCIGKCIGVWKYKYVFKDGLNLNDYTAYVQLIDDSGPILINIYDKLEYNENENEKIIYYDTYFGDVWELSSDLGKYRDDFYFLYDNLEGIIMKTSEVNEELKTNINDGANFTGDYEFKDDKNNKTKYGFDYTRTKYEKPLPSLLSGITKWGSKTPIVKMFEHFFAYPSSCNGQSGGCLGNLVSIINIKANDKKLSIAMSKNADEDITVFEYKDGHSGQEITDYESYYLEPGSYEISYEIVEQLGEYLWADKYTDFYTGSFEVEESYSYSSNYEYDNCVEMCEYVCAGVTEDLYTNSEYCYQYHKQCTTECY